MDKTTIHRTVQGVDDILKASMLSWAEQLRTALLLSWTVGWEITSGQEPHHTDDMTDLVDILHDSAPALMAAVDDEHALRDVLIHQWRWMQWRSASPRLRQVAQENLRSLGAAADAEQSAAVARAVAEVAAGFPEEDAELLLQLSMPRAREVFLGREPVPSWVFYRWQHVGQISATVKRRGEQPGQWWVSSSVDLAGQTPLQALCSGHYPAVIRAAG